MTKSQYSNVTKWTLGNVKVTASNDSLSVVREILKNCGLLPNGCLKEILLTLTNGDYML